MSSPDLSGLVDRFETARVLVIGDVMLDSYLEGSTDRLSREAPVPVVAITQRSDAPGGAANVASNVATLGGQVRLLSVTGDDHEGGRLRRELSQRGMSLRDVLIDDTRQTLSKQRLVANAQHLARFDQGTIVPIDGATERALERRLVKAWGEVDAVVVSDYSYGILTPRIRQTLHRLQRRAPKVIVLDAKDLVAYRGLTASAAKPNYAEAVRLLGEQEEQDPRNRPAQIESHAQRLLDIIGTRVVIVSMDTDGALVLERGQQPYRVFARPVRHSRVAGAGDTHVATLALALAVGATMPAAAELASAAATLVVHKQGTATCDAAELRDQVTAQDQKLTDTAALVRRLELHRQQGQSIVFTNGCFDILHAGHIAFLGHAKTLGDVLVVGLNSDASVSRLKGPLRPINTLRDRAQVLAGLSSVDYVAAFDEDLPTELIRAVRPHTFVKGGDYTVQRLPEAAVVEACGGVTRILPFVPERSTTRVIERIRRAAA